MNNDIRNLELSYKNFLQNLKDKGRSRSTILAYGSDIRQLKNYLQQQGKNNVAEITFNDLKGFKEHLQDAEYSPKTISRKINSMRTFFRYLINQNSVKENLAKRLDTPEIEISPPNYLTKTEYRALRDAASDDVRTYAVIELLLQTGVRVGEITDIKLTDIKNGKLHIRSHGKYEGRKIPLNVPAQKAINDYIDQRPETSNKHLFVTKSGKKLLIRNIRSSVERYFEEAGIEEAKLNDLRNTFIVHQLKAGVPLTTVSKLAGHKQITTTERYLELARKGSKTKEDQISAL
jgi:site-specific recombinase XerD